MSGAWVVRWVTGIAIIKAIQVVKRRKKPIRNDNCVAVGIIDALVCVDTTDRTSYCKDRHEKYPAPFSI